MRTETVEGGTWVYITDVNGEYKYFTADGVDGTNGTNGVSSSITTVEVEGGYNLIITTGTTVTTVFIANGADGTNGVDGINGSNGTNGINGINGIDGTNGVSVTVRTEIVEGGTILYITDITGTYEIFVENGEDGSNGLDGTNGLNGTNGTNGTNGEDGQNGSNGTNGINGIDGIDGEDGSNGTNGVNATIQTIRNITDTGYWLIVYQNNVEISRVEILDGEDGKNGLDGDDGIDGLNAHITVEPYDCDTNTASKGNDGPHDDESGSWGFKITTWNTLNGDNTIYNLEITYVCSSDFEVCDNCDGGVTSLDLEYIGSVDGATITVYKGPHEELWKTFTNVDNGDIINLVGDGHHGKLDNHTRLSINGGTKTEIHASCSVPIGIGSIFGDFKVIDGISKNGGYFCN